MYDDDTGTFSWVPSNNSYSSWKSLLTTESLIKTEGDTMTDAGMNEGARGSSWTQSDAGETVAVAHAVIEEVVGAAEQ